jgi:hypothetical protein
MSPPDREEHPIIAAAIRYLAEGESGAPVLIDGAREALAGELAELFESPELEAAVRELMAFAVYVGEKLGERSIALSLLGVAATATPALERAKLSTGEALRSAHRRASARLGRQSEARAPRVDSVREPGSVALSSLLSGLRGPRRG